jgi:hypothetical protein
MPPKKQLSKEEKEKKNEKEQVSVMKLNASFLDKVEKRCVHQIQLRLVSAKWPIKINNYDSLESRKSLKEFNKKDKHAYRCSLNAINNILPRGITLTVDDMHLIRDLKLKQLAKGAVVNMGKGIKKYPVEKLSGLYGNIYATVSTTAPLEYATGLVVHMPPLLV